MSVKAGKGDIVGQLSLDVASGDFGSYFFGWFHITFLMKKKMSRKVTDHRARLGRLRLCPLSDSAYGGITARFDSVEKVVPGGCRHL